MPYTIGLFRVQDPPLKVRYVSIALPLLTLQECNQGIYITYWMAASTPPAKTTVNVPVPDHPQLGMESWRVCIYDRQLLSMHAAHVLAIYIYIYICIEGKRERERASGWAAWYDKSKQPLSHSVRVAPLSLPPVHPARPWGAYILGRPTLCEAPGKFSGREVIHKDYSLATPGYPSYIWRQIDYINQEVNEPFSPSVTLNLPMDGKEQPPKSIIN